MKVTFTKEHHRYAVRVERERASTLYGHGPDTGGGLPHDILHFVAEAEFGLDYGIFGHLAAGMPTRIFVPADREEIVKIWRRNRIKRLRVPEGRRSEELVARVERQWHERTLAPELLAKLDELATRWQALQVGGSLTLAWPRPERRKHSGARKRRRPATARR
ncbi:MAG TPA: hypothetical protein VH541_02645 [Gaiellaceae bacterium]